MFKRFSLSSRRNRPYVRFGVLLLTVAVIGVLAPVTASAALTGNYTNPVGGSGDWPDPFILYGGSTPAYYLFGTNNGTQNVPVKSSSDLRTWGSVGEALQTRSGGSGIGSWATVGNTWAPSVLKRSGSNWVLYYSATDTSSGKLCIGRATATAIGGPYNDSWSSPLICQTSEGGSIHPSVVVLGNDGTPDDNDPHLFWVTRNDTLNPSGPIKIWSQPLATDGQSLRSGSSAAVVMTASTSAPENSLVMNPSGIYDSGSSTYFMFFSEASATTEDHATGWATCNTPAVSTGSFTSCTRGQEGSQNDPLLAKRFYALGPGGAEPFKDESAKLWFVYHASNDDMTVSPLTRQTRIDKLCFLNGVPRTNGPTWLQQSMTRDTACHKDAVPGGFDLDVQGFTTSSSGDSIRGKWDIDRSSAAKIVASSGSAGFDRIFRGNASLSNAVAEADVQWVASGTTITDPEYGIFASYYNSSNYVAFWVEKRLDRLVSAVYKAGSPTFQTSSLTSFVYTDWHNLRVKKHGTSCTFYLDGTERTALAQTCDASPATGHMGLRGEDIKANFKNVAQSSMDAVGTTTMIGRVNGPTAEPTGGPSPAPSLINDTCTGYTACGMDLGYSFDHNSKEYMVFGDTEPSPGQQTAVDRSNVMGISDDTTPSNGLTFNTSPNGMIVDGSNKAKELLSSKKIDNDEITVIPTSGISTTPTGSSGTQFLHYMSVKHWDSQYPGLWTTNDSRMASSTDSGQNWTKPSWGWSATSNFAQVAMTRGPAPDYNTLTFLWGIPAGRFGGVKLAYAPTADLGTQSAYRYWNGNTSSWSTSESDATIIIPGPVGELSVRYNTYYSKWVMMYLDIERYAIVVRTASNIEGPWDDARIVAAGTTWPQIVGGFMPERWNDAQTIYFTMSMFQPYKVYWMKSSFITQAP